MIVCAVDDLMFSVKITSAAKAVNAAVAFERTPDAVLARVRAERPSLVIFDLNSSRMRPIETIAAIKQDPALAGTRTLGFVSHVQTDVIERARRAGADVIMARSAFASQLAEILKGRFQF